LGRALLRPVLACIGLAAALVALGRTPVGRAQTRTAVKGAGGATTAEEAAEEVLFTRANAVRRARGLRPLLWDATAYAVLREAARQWAPDGEDAFAGVHKKADTRHGYDVAAGYQYAARAEAASAVDAVLESAYLVEPGYNQGAAVVVQGTGAAEGRVVAAVYVCAVPPRYGAAVANRPSADGYLFRCPACQRQVIYSVKAPRGGIYSCPSCKTVMTAFIDDMAGINHWATFFPRPFGRVPPSNPFLAWQWTNEHIHYNHAKADHDMPGWQTPTETQSLGTGVCRDTAVFLCAWLRHLGADARVVSGLHGQGHHAWVVLFEGDKRYLLETAMDGPTHMQYPPRLELAQEYFPTRMMFDDARVWAKVHESSVRDYESPAHWIQIKEAP
jgi:hypothetical protein